MSKKHISLKELAAELLIIGKADAEAFSGGRGNLRSVFVRSEEKIYFYDDNNTPSDTSDDRFLFSGEAHNNTVNKNQMWPNGEYNMLDQTGGHHHASGDTANGPYGTSGIYRAEEFQQEDGRVRSGMGIHSGRSGITLFENRKTNGCIRVEQSTMDQIDRYTGKGMRFNHLTIK